MIYAHRISHLLLSLPRMRTRSSHQVVVWSLPCSLSTHLLRTFSRHRVIVRGTRHIYDVLRMWAVVVVVVVRERGSRLFQTCCPLGGISDIVLSLPEPPTQVISVEGSRVFLLHVRRRRCSRSSRGVAAAGRRLKESEKEEGDDEDQRYV